MSDSFVPILMGSKGDLEHAQAIAEALGKLGVGCELRIGSAHKTPARVLDMLRAYEADPRPKVYITIAGRSNALSGFVDGNVTAPVIACPPYSEKFGGADVYSTLRMPSGVAPATVIEPEAAALLAAKILALQEPSLRARVAAYQDSMRAKLAKDDEELAAGRGQPSAGTR
jgi:5-(carboxyamino)imidazole ribonucleotide mutase